MIHLDSSALIALPVLARQRHDLTRRIALGEPAAASSIAWFEYVCGPIADSEPPLVRAVLSEGVVQLDQDAAEFAATLFNAVDFRPFVHHGLKLLPLKG
ncbi:MAG: hypothetical protein AB7H93_02180 [Vicinamibacterales bacterium]